MNTDLNMADVKYIKDYIPELATYFPEIGEEELLRMTLQSTGILRRYIRHGRKGFIVASSKSLSGENKVERFTATKVMNRKELNSARKGFRIRAEQQALKDKENNGE